MKKITLCLILCLGLLLSGCGQTAAPSASSASTASKTISSASASTVRTLKHAMGEIKLSTIPKRVVVLEWSYVECFLAMGIVPVGVADMKGYSNWVVVGLDQLSKSTDVGTRQEPNLEAIMALEPDLIIAESFRVAKNYDKLNEIAPTYVFDSYAPDAIKDHYASQQVTIRTIGEIMQTKDMAEKTIRDLEAYYAQAKEKLTTAGLAGKKYVLTNMWSTQNNVTLRLFTDTSTVCGILSKMGLVNAYKIDETQKYGYSEGSIELLVPVADSLFIYTVQDTDNVIENQLKNNEVFSNLAFVREKRMYPLGSGTWLFPGPLSSRALADKILKTLGVQP